MRIISGKFKRRFITPPRNLPVRPTTDLARESLFNILESKTELEGKEILDLFSGTGAVSYEFMSRGVKRALAVDNHYKCVQFIRKTASEFEMKELNIIKGDVFKFLTNTNLCFDLIFADPPYDMENLDILPDLVFANHLLKESGYFILEHPKIYDFSSHPNFLEHRKYGKVNFTFFMNGEDLEKERVSKK
jgi:16S rRNA (guanine(966)-N(2))-methyltransferase RsmD